MGTFTTRLRIWNPEVPGQVEGLEVWVDTGAGYSWISRDRMEKLGIRPTRRVQFRTIEGRVIEREMAPAFVATDGYIGGDTIVMAEPGDAEVMGTYTLESLGLSVDVVHKKLVPVVVGLALAAIGSPSTLRHSRIVEAIDAAIQEERLVEPFSNENFRAACPGFGNGTYNAFLWKHARGNPGGKTAFFERADKDSVRRTRS